MGLRARPSWSGTVDGVLAAIGAVHVNIGAMFGFVTGVWEFFIEHKNNNRCYSVVWEAEAMLGNQRTSA